MATKKIKTIVMGSEDLLDEQELRDMNPLPIVLAFLDDDDLYEISVRSCAIGLMLVTYQKTEGFAFEAANLLCSP